MAAKVKVAPVEMPNAVLIGSVIYEVTTNPIDWLRIENATQRKGYYGHTEPLSAIIYISPNTSLDTQRLTLWHEIMHAMCETMMGSPDWLNLGEDNAAREERVIRAFESPVVCVLRDNPALVAYLTA